DGATAFADLEDRKVRATDHIETQAVKALIGGVEGVICRIEWHGSRMVAIPERLDGPQKSNL
ncbi:MAG TPA: hypothetical protein DEO57_07070, partial [Phycisphaerales bacterium]|nr:hypothetical protein [Phycisphaerales bacterium]